MTYAIAPDMQDVPTTKDFIEFNSIGSKALPNGGDGILITGATDCSIGFTPFPEVPYIYSSQNVISYNDGDGIGLVPTSEPIDHQRRRDPDQLDLRQW